MIQLIFILLLSVSLQAASPVIGAYFDKQALSRPPHNSRPEFSITKIPSGLLTDLYFAFIPFGLGMNPNAGIQFSANDDDKEIFLQMQDLKKQSGKMNLFLSLGGWGFNSPKTVEGAQTFRLFSQMAAFEGARRHFIDGIITYAYQNGFDGIDIDWEYPGDLTRGGHEEDLDNFLLLLQEFQVRFETTQPKLLLTAAFPATMPAGLPKAYQDAPDLFFKWIAKCSKYLEWVNLMAYDYHGPFDQPKITGVNAPLMHDTDPKSTLYIAKSIENYLTNGVPKEKIVLGIPLFGHAYSGITGLSKESYLPGKPFHDATPPSPVTRTPGMLAYFEIADLIKSNTFQFGSDPLTNTALSYSVDKKEWISFDTPETIKFKAELAAAKGLKGIFFWSIDMDEYQWAPPFPGITAGKAAFIH